MKKSLFFLLFTLSFFNSFSQVGINTTSPNAQLDISSSNQATPSNTDGILIPKIDNFPIVNPTAAQQGMLVYLTTLVGTNAPGFYYWDNVSVTWIALKGASDADWHEVGGTNSPNDINDNMYHLGNVAIGKNIANYPFEVNANDAEIGINYSMTASSSLTTRRGIQNVISGTSNDLIYGFYNQIRNSGTGIHYGNYALLSGSGSIEKYGSYNRIINGSGNKFGSYNYISGAGDNIYGNYNFIENSTGLLQYGNYNLISNNNNTVKTGTYNVISGSGNVAHFGVTNSLQGTGTGEQTAVYNHISNNGDGLQFGMKNIFLNSSNGDKKGVYSEFNNTTGTDYGIEQWFNNGDSSGAQYGLRNVFQSNKPDIFGIYNNMNNTIANATGMYNQINGSFGAKTGVRNDLFGSGSAIFTGTTTTIGGSGTGEMSGHRVFFDYSSGTNTGNKYGYYVSIPTLVGGNHFGVFSVVENSNGYAGYFLGRTAIGTTSANTYILPLSRGTNGQIMQTDGSGNVTWQNPNTALNNFAWTTGGNSGTDPNTNFIGTSDNADLVFKRGGVLAGRIRGNHSVYFGYESNLNAAGVNNAAFGTATLKSNATGNNNAAFGSGALFSNVSGSFNTGIGNGALTSNTIGGRNVAVGESASHENTIGAGNVSVGSQASYSNTSGNNNSSMGSRALFNNIAGLNNTAIGSDVLFNSTTSDNTGVGFSSINSATTGFRNTALGSRSGQNITTGSYNTALGANAYSTSNYSNSAAIGDASAISADNQIRLGDASVTSIGGFANWTNVSDQRFKKNIQENVSGLAFITKLKPVTYSLDLNAIHSYLKTPSEIRKPETETDKKQEIQTGFIAQDVEKVATELGFSFSGVDKPKNNEDYYGLRYAEFVVPLVKAVQEQQVIIEKQQEKIQSLEERLLKLETMFTKE